MVGRFFFQGEYTSENGSIKLVNALSVLLNCILILVGYCKNITYCNDIFVYVTNFGGYLVPMFTNIDTKGPYLYD